MVDREGLADDRAPICPFCGCTRHDSERLHDGNLMETEALVDAMISVFLRDPDRQRDQIERSVFPEDYPSAQHARLRLKMKAALGVAIRNMPYLRASPDRGEGKRVREAAAAVCDWRAQRARMALQGGVDGAVNNRTAEATATALAAQIRALPLAQEEKS